MNKSAVTGYIRDFRYSPNIVSGPSIFGLLLSEQQHRRGRMRIMKRVISAVARERDENIVDDVFMSVGVKIN